MPVVNVFEAGSFLFSMDYLILEVECHCYCFEDRVIIAKWLVWFPSKGDTIIVAAGHGSEHENDQNLYRIVVGKGNSTCRCNVDMCVDDNIKMSVANTELRHGSKYFL
jgi:hypothetical protein